MRAFATTAMVNTFTLGFGSDVYYYVRKYLEDTLHKLSDKIVQDLGGTPPANLGLYISQALDEHSSAWTFEMRKSNSFSLQRVIGSLPIPKMANSAETMINLQSLKEKVTRPSESVSGPIDIAVITKSEGLIWIKRKFFFDSSLNPRYFLRQKQNQ